MVNASKCFVFFVQFILYSYLLSVTVVDRSWDRKKAFLIFPMLFCPGNVNEVQCSRTSSQLLVSYDTFKEIPLIVFFLILMTWEKTNSP